MINDRVHVYILSNGITLIFSITNTAILQERDEVKMSCFLVVYLRLQHFMTTIIAVNMKLARRCNDWRCFESRIVSEKLPQQLIAVHAFKRGSWIP